MTTVDQEMVEQFALWNKSYSWGVILIGPDVSGFLIMYGIDIADTGKRLWRSELFKSEILKKAIGQAEETAIKIERDPSGYIDSIFKTTIPPLTSPPHHAYCRLMPGEKW